ncbi:uncharacterized protein LOC125036211 [Penaeus chinensis]|uniref:uncharacterized protein LOC125036211 n=1 Tax=Penaeus chinensis TaxID=139456 RepID=UPI001FB7D90B|nr:uncharacterized protein LOC125036211 [Penaeus chinensis]
MSTVKTRSLLRTLRPGLVLAILLAVCFPVLLLSSSIPATNDDFLLHLSVQDPHRGRAGGVSRVRREDGRKGASPGREDVHPPSSSSFSPSSVPSSTFKFYVDDYKGMIGLHQEDPQVLDWTRRQFKTSSAKRYKFNGVLNALDDRYLSASQEFIGEQVQKLFNASLAKGAPGTFLEAGAYDGEFLSNTLWLEVESGWRGVLVEPNPESFSRLLSKGRRGALALNSCLSTSPRVSTTALNLHVVPEQRAANISAEYWRSSSRGREMEASQDWQGVVKTEVLCLPLYSILAAARLTSLDFLSLDVEYVEMGVLSSLPWDKVDIKVFAIEHLTEEDLEAFMSERGYSLFARQGEDWVFIKRKYFVVN